MFYLSQHLWKNANFGIFISKITVESFLKFVDVLLHANNIVLGVSCASRLDAGV